MNSDILKAGLFKSGYETSVGSQFGGSKVVTIVATALNKNKADLMIYLCPEVTIKLYTNHSNANDYPIRINKSFTKQL